MSEKVGKALVRCALLMLPWALPVWAADLPAELRGEASVLLAKKAQYRLHLFASGRLVRTYIIGLSQNPIGPKERAGDNRTPEGRYRIIQKAVGPFPGDYGAYFGTRWMRINYPNERDAAVALRRGVIDQRQHDRIVRANRQGREPPRETALGGGIGIHGWAGKWPGEDRQNLTWGCLSLQREDLEDLYARVSVGTVIVIDP